ncbi:MAG TPA: Zn-dependent hydrolase [Tepidisphaeraceae bacterium]|jgi:N-carbamoyl-L-amino-acid hydrolase|nr:Zn-dependent hydrolase [Tepidisphaeraceae bacterium]
MPIRPDRILADIDAIAAFSESLPDVGYSRPTFSPPWVAARDYVIAQATAAGCKVRIDAAGNVHARPVDIDWIQPTWLSGSHIDSVPTGGKYDGVMGIVVPLEVLRAAHEAGRHDLPLELIIFAEEEGTTFNLGMLGSHAWAGTLSIDKLAAVRNRDGQNYLEAGAAHGVNPDRLAAERLRAGTYRGLIEVHAEQGQSMGNANVPVALVTAINGRRQYAGSVIGTANHAGSTAMDDRCDALVAMAECIIALESLGHELAGRAAGTVVTVGQVWPKPNAINVIPGEVAFTVDLRARSSAMLSEADERVVRVFSDVVARRGVQCAVRCTESLPAIPMDDTVCTALQSAASKVGLDQLPAVTSGALHDAAILAPIVPTAMLFVASEGGISHNPAEFSRIEDIALAARILAAAVET